MPGMVALAGGAVGEMIGAAAGLGSVMEAVQHVPALAYAANQAMQQFNKGIGAAASSAVGQGVPAFHALGTALGSLGTEVGHVGAEQMGTVLNGATGLAQNATSALKALEPAIGPAVQGAFNLGDALLQGVANPAVATGIRELGQSLSGAGVAEAVSDITTGVLTAGTIVTKAASDVLGGIAGVFGPQVSQDASPAISGAIGGAMIGKAFGGVPGMLVGGALGGLGIGAAAAEQKAGMDSTPGLIGEVGGSALGGLLGGPIGALAGEIGRAHV